MTGPYNSGNFNLGRSAPLFTPRTTNDPSRAQSTASGAPNPSTAPRAIQPQSVDPQPYNQIVSFVRNQPLHVSTYGITSMDEADDLALLNDPAYSDLLLPESDLLLDPSLSGIDPALLTSMDSSSLGLDTSSMIMPDPTYDPIMSDPFRRAMMNIQTGFYGAAFAPNADPGRNQFIEMPSIDSIIQQDLGLSTWLAEQQAYINQLQQQMPQTPAWMPTYGPGTPWTPPAGDPGMDPNLPTEPETDPNTNTDPDQIGDLNDIIEITDDSDLLTDRDDELDMGSGLDELTINADNRRGTIKTSNVNSGEATAEDGSQATEDIITINGKKNKLTILADARDAIHLQGSLKTDDNPHGEWTARKVTRHGKEVIIYTNRKDRNEITVQGGAKVLFIDEEGEANFAENLWSPIKDSSMDPKEYADSHSFAEIANNAVFENMTESEQDYVALRALLKATKSEVGENLDDDKYSLKDILATATAAQRRGNDKLAEKLRLIGLSMNTLTLLDGRTGDHLSREELNKILDELRSGKTLAEIIDQLN